MTAQLLSHDSNRALTHRPAVDILVERAARRMLAWSDRRAERTAVSHERMDLIRANAGVRGGSKIAR